MIVSFPRPALWTSSSNVAIHDLFSSVETCARSVVLGIVVSPNSNLLLFASTISTSTAIQSISLKLASYLGKSWYVWVQLLPSFNTARKLFTTPLSFTFADVPGSSVFHFLMTVISLLLSRLFTISTSEYPLFQFKEYVFRKYVPPIWGVAFVIGFVLSALLAITSSDSELIITLLSSLSFPISLTLYSISW